MKKRFVFVLVIALLLFVVPALAEITWGAWIQEEPNYWIRHGLDPAQPDIQFSEYARGEALEELFVIGFTETRHDGASTFITSTYYNTDGVTISEVYERTLIDGQLTQTLVKLYFYGNGVLSSSTLYVEEDGGITRFEREEYDTQGNLMLITMGGSDSQGHKLEEVSYSPDMKHIRTTTYEYLEDNSYIATSTLPDGRLVHQQMSMFINVDENGNGMFREVVLVSFDSAGNRVALSEINPDGSILERTLYKTDSGGFETYTELTAIGEDSDIRLSYVHTKYDRFGNFIEGSVYDPETGELVSTSHAPENDLLRDEWLKNNPQKPDYVWYPSNTVTTAGFAFRDERPELTDKWYQFTPVDLSRDGSYRFELVGGSVYILGKVVVDVKGDEVIVRYATTNGKHGNVMMESEFFTFFPDLNSVSTVEPEELGEGFKFGEPISIEKDLNGDTRVLLFVRNVATFADHVGAELPRTRYWHNHPSRVANREALRTLMD